MFVVMPCLILQSWPNKFGKGKKKVETFYSRSEVSVSKTLACVCHLPYYYTTLSFLSSTPHPLGQVQMVLLLVKITDKNHSHHNLNSNNLHLNNKSLGDLKL
ncbi:hypothetical protein RIF29_16527 [Crotalaria pallida]|uniref:Uncharacterized protein n=1 Tax=Crotalaria pallida TaxID=3830 RepID=A0AAN9IJW8_CROPI